MKNFIFSLFVCVNLWSIAAQNASIETDSLNTSRTEELALFKKLLDSSNTFYNGGEYTKSLDLNIKILDLAYKLEDPYFIHQGYRYLGYDYMIIADTLLAIDSFKKSEKYAIQSKNDTATAVTYMDLANIFAFNENYKKALRYHDQSIEYFKKIKDSASLAKAHYNTVFTAFDDENYEKAFHHIVEAKELLKYADHKSFSIGIDNFFGYYYLKVENYELADQYLLKVIEEAKKEDIIIELENAYYSYSESLFSQKRYKEAYEALEVYQEYKDELYGSLINDESKSLTAKYQLEEYRKDIRNAKINNELQAEIVENKSRLNKILIAVSAVFLMLLIALFSISRKRIKLVKLLRLKNKEYLKAKEQTEKLSKAKNKFFSTVSHELRTPLYGVIGLSTILMEDETLKKHKKDIKSLKFSADYLLALINDVLQINKIDSENLDHELTSFDIRELVGTISSSFEYMRIQNNNSIHIEISNKIPQLIKGNSIRLSQILMNLIGNACKFTENGNVYIIAEETFKDNDIIKVRFSIKDNGIGIAKEQQNIIFEEFSQLESNNYSYEGTGLGLPIVKKLLSASNSQIELESEQGKGSIFSFEIDFELVEHMINPVEPIELDTEILLGKKVLIVEDNRINQIVTKKILEKNDIRCTVVENGEKAVKIVKERKFDLILMDINMPVKNGIEASKEIRAFNSSIPIIALTAVEIEELRTNIYFAGMNDIIVKPYDVTKFIETIIRNISSPKLTDKTTLEAI
jgi:signal transduction histidine kinase/ActR/RegA family two-component response regulator